MILSDIGGEWYLKKKSKNLPPLIKKKLIKNHKRNMIKLKGTYRLPIGIGIIVNSGYIGTCLSVLIQEVNV